MPQKIISLKNQKEFDAVNRAGKKFVGKFMIVVVSGSNKVVTERHCEEFRIKRGMTKQSQVTSEISLNKNEIATSPATPRNDATSTHLGLKVGRKYGNAVLRNKFKRRIRAIAHEFSKSHEGCSFIVIPKSYATKADYQALKKDFNKIYTQTK